MKFLLECLQDLDDQLKEVGAELFIYRYFEMLQFIKRNIRYETCIDSTEFTYKTLKHFRGNPVTIFERFKASLEIGRICIEQDCEPCYRKRDLEVKKWCAANKIEFVERVGHTLWDPHKVR